MASKRSFWTTIIAIVTSAVACELSFSNGPSPATRPEQAVPDQLVPDPHVVVSRHEVGGWVITLRAHKLDDGVAVIPPNQSVAALQLTADDGFVASIPVGVYDKSFEPSIRILDSGNLLVVTYSSTEFVDGDVSANVEAYYVTPQGVDKVFDQVRVIYDPSGDGSAEQTIGEVYVDPFGRVFLNIVSYYVPPIGDNHAASIIGMDFYRWTEVDSTFVSVEKDPKSPRDGDAQ